MNSTSKENKPKRAQTFFPDWEISDSTSLPDHISMVNKKKDTEKNTRQYIVSWQLH